MMVQNRGSTIRLMMWQWKFVALFVMGAFVAYILHELFQWRSLILPTVPMAIVGGAIGIFVSFRTNSAYDRWWEGRKLWGRLINTSRHWCSQITNYLSVNENQKEITASIHTLIYRQIQYVHTLRVLLRKQNLIEDSELQRLLPEEARVELAEKSNPTHDLLQQQFKDICELKEKNLIDAFQLQSLDESIRQLLDIQGGCERIKNTPMPRGYGFIAQRLIIVFGLLFPFAIIEELGWISIPVNILVCLAFALISETGRVLEDPFTMFWNGLPLSALSRTIEVNLREQLGEKDLPPMLIPDESGILM